MIKIFDKNKNFIKGTEDYKDIKIEEEQNLTSTLSFSIPLSFKDIFEEEGYVEVRNEGSFVIKEININIESISIVCKQNLEDLTSNVSNKAYATKTMQYILDDLLAGTGWTGIADTNISRTVTGTNMSVLDYIYKAIDIFKYEVKFDSVNKKIIAKEKIGSDKGVYFHDEVNLKSTNISSDTYDFVTRIIPLGFEDMGIELINGGKSYVENHSYSNKIITLEWKDERYTVAENLKRDAALKLEKLCRPLRTYSCSIEDLSKSKDYSILNYEVGDTIDLIDREKGIREKQRITKTVKYLNREGEDAVQIANRPRIFGEDLEDKIDEINSNISSTNSKLELLDDKIIAEVETINQSVADNVKTINEKIGQLIITDSEISNMVADLTTIVSDNYNEVNNKIGKLDIKADGITASVSSLNTKVDLNKNQTDTRLEQAELKITSTAINATVSQQIETKVGNLSTQVNNKFAALNIDIDGITSSVSNLEIKTDNQANVFTKRFEAAELKITSTAINATVSSQITEKVNGAITHTNDKFAELNITIDGITSSVSNLETKVDKDNKALKTRIEEAEFNITPTKINAAVSQQITEKVNSGVSTAQTYTNNKFAELNTSIDGISGRVTTVDTKINNNITTTNERLGSLELTDSKFETRITSAQSTANSANTNASNAKNMADSAYSVATQTANDITQKVSKGDIASTINQTAQSVKIQASKISLVGAVSVLSDLSGNLGSITAGTINLGTNAFRVDGNGTLYAGRDGFKVPWNADGIYNNFQNAARWKYDDYNYIHQDSSSVNFFSGSTNTASIRFINDSGRWGIQLGQNGARIKSLADSTTMQIRDRWDSDYGTLRAGDFTTQAGSIVPKTMARGMTLEEGNSKLDVVKNTPIYDIPLQREEVMRRTMSMKEDTSKFNKRITFVEGEIPPEIESFADGESGISMTNMTGVLWRAVQELSAKVDSLEKIINDNKKEVV